MKTATAELIYLLATYNEYAMYETYTFTLIDGTVIVYTMGDPPRVPPVVYIDCDLLLHFDETDPTLWIDYSLNRRSLTLYPNAGSIVSSLLGEFDVDPVPAPGAVVLVGPGDAKPAVQFVQAYPGDRSPAHYGSHSYIAINGNLKPGASDFILNVSITFLGSTNNFGYCVLLNMGVNAVADSGFYLYFLPLASNPTNVQLVFSSVVDLGGGTFTAKEIRVDNTQVDVGVRRRYTISRKGQQLTAFKDGVIQNQNTVYNSTSQAIVDSVRGFMRLGCSDVGGSASSASLIDSFNGIIDELYFIHGAGIGLNANFTPRTQEWGR